MATAPTVSFHWKPEDDLLLKNAVEAGASLEALAKGAVPFSQRYTLRELQDRWHSLLYDPDISAQTAAQIFELEISGSNAASKFKSEGGSKEVSHKRKSSSIRQKYYAMRKKFRAELFSNSDVGLFEPNSHEFSEQSADFQNQVMQVGNHLSRTCMIGDGMTDHPGLQEEHLDILRHAFPGTMSDLAVGGATNLSRGYGLDENVTSSLKGGSSFSEVDIRNGKTPFSLRKSSMDEKCHNSSVGFEGGQQFASSNSDGFPLQSIVFAPDQQHLHHWRRMQDVSASSVPASMSLPDPAQIAVDAILNDNKGKENSSTICASEFADPDSLLNLSNEDEMLLEDVDEKHLAKKCYINNTGLVVQDSTKDCHENDTEKAELESTTIAEIIPAIVAVTKPMVSVVSSSCVHGDQQMNTQSVVDSSSKSTLISDSNGLGDGKICCTLNTEDTEIPCNDDIFLLIHPSTSFGSSATQPNTTAPMTSVAHEKDYEQALDFSMKANDSAKAFVWPHIHGMSESHAITEIHDTGFKAPIPGSSKCGSQYAIPKQCSNSLVKKEVAGAGIKNEQNPSTVTEIIRSTEAGSARSQPPESVVDNSASDEVESEIDDEVPYFSDIEAMILEMDLDPYDHDSNRVKKDPSYQFEETKRTIIRLEQSAHSCLQRAMTSQEALAILYGRHSRHYIRKPEVLIGRATDDFDVDIDLRREGRANKISRRQAIIKMEADGSFFLKNLGKSSVSVNGAEIASGQLLNLSTNCLIEIKEMSFVFEINQHYVRKHLGKFCLKNKGKSDWSAEDES